MPSRTLTIAIVVFWLVTAAWYVKREIWPRITLAAPPPYVIDLADEALRHAVPVRWAVYRNGQYLAPMRTSIDYNEKDDSFQLECNFPTEFEFAKIGDQRVTVLGLENCYRVKRSGELLGTATNVSISAANQKYRLEVRSEVRSGLAYFHCQLETPVGVFEPKLEPVPVTRAGVFTPMHPVHRIDGLRPGMHWRMPLLDPIADGLRYALIGLARGALGDIVPQSLSVPSTKTLIAEVTGPHELEWQGQGVPCYVIEYRDDEYRAKTWLRVTDGTVLRQEATAGGEELVLQRE